VLGVDIGSSSIKVVQLKKQKGALMLETYGALALGPAAGLEVGRVTNLPAEKIADVLTNLLKEANVTTRHCGISIPISASLVTVIELPRLDARQLSSMMSLEARRYVPVPIDEVELDWFIIPESELQLEAAREESEDDKVKPKRQVLLVAIHKEALQKYNAVVEKARLIPHFFEIEIFSTIRSTLSRSIAPVVVLDIGAGTSKLYIVEFGVVRVSHTINKGGQDMTFSLARSTGVSIAKAEELKREYGLSAQGLQGEARSVSQSILFTLEYIFAEARRVILKYEKQSGRNISKIVLTGGGAVTRGILGAAKEHFEIETVLADPFSSTEAPAFLENVLKEVGPEFAVAVGLAERRLQELL
jgi:type IV pilus assembly protein PilM